MFGDRSRQSFIVVGKKWSFCNREHYGVNSFSFNVWYPDSFDGGHSLRLRTYKVHWFIATDSKHVIATDTFEVSQKN